jgi:hypothetical protein
MKKLTNPNGKEVINKGSSFGSTNAMVLDYLKQ